MRDGKKGTGNMGMKSPRDMGIDSWSIDDIDEGLSFAHREDGSTIDLLIDIAETTDWDKLPRQILKGMNTGDTVSIGSYGLVIDFQYTTNLEFADWHTGCGTLAEIGFDGVYSEPLAKVSIESNDRWIEERGIPGRGDPDNDSFNIAEAIKMGTEKLHR